MFPSSSGGYSFTAAIVDEASTYMLMTDIAFDDAPEGAVTLLEWPDRAAGFLPTTRLDVDFTLEPQIGSNGREVRITGYGSFAPRAERSQTIRRVLARSDFGRAERHR